MTLFFMTLFTVLLRFLVVAALMAGPGSGSGPGIASGPDAGSSPTAARPLPASLAWGWPLAGRPRVVHAFDPPAQPWLSGHRGVDLTAPPGARVLAPVAGLVSFSGRVVDREVLTITTATGLRLSFEPVASTLHAGDAVARGQPLGTLAAPTHCDGGPPGAERCLHWGVRRGDRYLNPLQFIFDMRPSVLLPLEGRAPAAAG